MFTGSRTKVKSRLRDRGRELVLPQRSGLGSVRHIRFERYSLPSKVAQTLDRSTGTMTVPLHRMLNRAGFSFAPDGWHPYVAALEEKLADPSRDYRDSVLARYYARFQPRTVHDLLLDGLAVPRATLASWPAVDRLIDIWSATEKQVRDSCEDVGPSGASTRSQFRGPTNEPDGASHLARCVDVYSSVFEHGYRPSQGGFERFVTGFFLTRGDDYRFIIGHGNHRVAALSLLGYEEIPVTLRRRDPPIVAEDRLDRWTTARGGLMQAHEVQAVFDHFFADDSNTRAAAMGLL